MFRKISSNSNIDKNTIYTIILFISNNFNNFNTQYNNFSQLNHHNIQENFQ